MYPARAHRSRPAYSLIELVVVLTILAIVAGLTVSIVGWLRRSADKGTASHVMGSLLSNVELYRVTYGFYPDQWDSLLEPGGASFYAKLPSAFLTGDKFAITNISGTSELGSLTKIGVKGVMDHVEAGAVEGAPGNTGTSYRALADGATVVTFASTPNGNKIIDSIYPPAAGGASGTGLPAGVKLLVFGFGPRNTAVGKTIVSPPSYSGVGDPMATYDRYLGVFAVYADGKRAQLKAVLDTTGDFLYQELAEFHGNKPQ
jgi:prepilin-type N-terminal cleavage/methylation domain-containing protein